MILSGPLVCNMMVSAGTLKSRKPSMGRISTVTGNDIVEGRYGLKGAVGER